MTGIAKLVAPGCGSLSASWTRAIVRSLAARGIDGRSLAAAVGIDLTSLDDPDARVPAMANTELWRCAVRATADPCFGLYVSRFVSFTTFPALSAALSGSDTLRAALHRLGQYSHVIADIAFVTVEDGRESGEFRVEPAPGGRLADEGVDAAVSLTLRAARVLREDFSLNPLQVTLMRPEPSPSVAFQAFFRAPITFRGDRNALEFSANELDTRLPTRNLEISRSGERILDRLLARLRSRQLVNEVQTVLVGRLPNHQFAQGIVARTLGLSVRTLHRRMAEAGTSYRAVVMESRLSLAQGYLDDGLTATEVARVLGFSSLSSFSRAFRQWTGRSPSAKRQKPTDGG